MLPTWYILEHRGSTPPAIARARAGWIQRPCFLKNKDPGPEGLALIIPKGDLVYRHLTICGVLEYWSGGVMEETPFFIALRKHIPKENLKV